MSTPRAEHVLRYSKIKETLVFLAVLEDDHEFQRNIACPFHNFGRERKPSGRVYEDDEGPGRFYCFTCQKSWNPIDFVMEYKKMGFQAAMHWLESKFDIPPLDARDFLPEKGTKPAAKTEEDLTQTLTYVDSLLRRLRGKVPVSKFRTLGDIVDVLYVKARVPSVEVAGQVEKLLEKVRDLERA